jgi:hypothetical protein
MAFTAGFGQGNLVLTFAETRAIFIAVLAHTLMAGDAFFEMGMSAIFDRNRAATGAAQTIRPLFKAVTDRDAFVKDETFALPKAAFLWHFLKIF